MNKTILIGGGAILIAAIAAFWWMVAATDRATPVVNAAMHGAGSAAGSDQGPPLIHKIYEPSHRANISFAMAANNGVRAHHWGFGNLPAVEGITDVKNSLDHGIRPRSPPQRKQLYAIDITLT